MRDCDICGNAFQPKAHNTKRCGPKCVAAYQARFAAKKRSKLPPTPIRHVPCIKCAKVITIKPKCSVDRAACKECAVILRSESIAKFRKTNKAIAIQRKHNATDNRKSYLLDWRRMNIDKLAKQKKERMKTDHGFRIKTNLRARIHRILRAKKSQKTMELTGCSSEFLKGYLESKFTEGMNWSNYGLFGWHIDHIIPLASFSFYTNEGLENTEEMKRAMHYTNLQPLWAKDNISKGDKILT